MASARASVRPRGPSPCASEYLTMARCTLRQAVDIGCVRCAALITTACRTRSAMSAAPGQRHHAAVGSADAAVQAVDAEVIEQPHDASRPGRSADAREYLAVRRPGRRMAATEEVDAEHAVAIRVQRAARTDALLPPARGSPGRPKTCRPAEMPPSATTTGAPCDPASRKATSTAPRLPPKCSGKASLEAQHVRATLVAFRRTRSGCGSFDLALRRHVTNELPADHLGPQPKLRDSRELRSQLPRPTPPAQTRAASRQLICRRTAVPVELAPFRAGWTRRLPRLQRAIPSAGLDERAQFRCGRRRSVKAARLAKSRADVLTYYHANTLDQP